MMEMELTKAVRVQQTESSSLFALMVSDDVFLHCHCSVCFLPIRQNRDRFTKYSYTRNCENGKSTFNCFFRQFLKSYLKSKKAG